RLPAQVERVHVRLGELARAAAEQVVEEAPQRALLGRAGQRGDRLRELVAGGDEALVRVAQEHGHELVRTRGAPPPHRASSRSRGSVFRSRKRSFARGVIAPQPPGPPSKSSPHAPCCSISCEASSPCAFGITSRSSYFAIASSRYIACTSS